MDPRSLLILHSLGLLVLAFLGYNKVVAPEICGAVLVGLFLPSPVSSLRAAFNQPKSDGTK